MNDRSLSHNYVQMQQQSSWIDDPFQLGTHAIKGMTHMSHERNLYNYAEELVGQYAKYEDDQYDLSLNMLPQDEQNELVRLYIESIDRETSECVYGDDFTINSDFTCALLAMLKDDNKKSRANFAEVTRRNILIYYKDSLNDILSAACDNFLHAEMDGQGYCARQDLDSGEVIWGKF